MFVSVEQLNKDCRPRQSAEMVLFSNCRTGGIMSDSVIVPGGSRQTRAYVTPEKAQHEDDETTKVVTVGVD